MNNDKKKFCYILGPTGPMGPTGPAGKNGPTTITVGKTETIDAGMNASVDNIGTDKDVILDFKIPRGEKGISGVSDTIEFRNTITGLPGTSAMVTDTTGSPHHIIDFTIPQGIKGDKGEKGDKGDKGDNGVSEAISIGLTETIDAGEDAMVQDDFENLVHHLTFYIPKGEKGEQGPIGLADTITVGKTITGNPGTNASVVDNKYDRLHVLDFTIPQGPTGPAGPSGGGTKAYAQRYLSSTQTLNFPASIDTIVPLNELGQSLNCDFTAAFAIKILHTGTYLISYYFSAIPQETADMLITARRNDVLVLSSDIAVDWEPSFVKNISNTIIANLEVNDILTLNVRPLNSINLTFNGNTSASLSVLKID